ncbi:hypothetical protein M8818_003161 [Zalaria obscura]|uniref:Uncharacterized protein n=1 Tax=Zalaria obscura TaxID=2024903 RepID=A0ACC3SF76_9PEZI
MTDAQRPWWKDAVIYQIYPASFKDSNADGIGDIPGITRSLDYIKNLGVDTIWICPMYDSPQIDMGYDISDYQKVYPPYGTVADMEELIHQTHSRDMRLILDLVINHTSDQHAWFKESRSSKDNAKRDWYIWKPARYDGNGKRQPPNNWRSNFGGGSAWEWDEHSQEYYLHLFCVEQPDLNWDNEETRKAIYDSAMTFWLDKGVDGFRIDTVNMYSKNPTYPDAPITDHDAEWQSAGVIYCNGPRMHEFLQEMNAILARYDAMSVGECPHTPDRNKVLQYVGAKQKQLNMVFQFDVVDIGMGSVFKYQTKPRAYTLPDFKKAVLRTQDLLDGTDAWTTAFLENHDQARSISRWCDDSPQWRVRSGKLLALMLASLSGTLYIYEGQEIGMINIPKDWTIEEYKDIDSKDYYNHVAEQSGNDSAKLADALAAIQYLGRDNARIPMQWAPAPNGGFTDASAQAWMRINDSVTDINVAQQLHDKDSVLAFWRRTLSIRKQHNDLLVHGTFRLLDVENPHVFSFVKEYQDRKALFIGNFSGEERQVPDLPTEGRWRGLVGNIDSHEDDLAPWEGRIYLVE